jgi:hypothetical protein
MPCPMMGTSESGNTEEPHNGSRIVGTRTVYRIVVRDELSERFAVAFEGMEMETKCGQTILTGEVVDQPQLHGILDRIAGLGLELVSVQPHPEREAFKHKRQEEHEGKQ